MTNAVYGMPYAAFVVWRQSAYRRAYSCSLMMWCTANRRKTDENFPNYIRDKFVISDSENNAYETMWSGAANPRKEFS